MMAKAEVVWEDQLGARRGVLAQLEDTSISGACIRISIPISVGAKLSIKWHKEQFFGITKYCRRDGGDYVLGVERENSETEARPTLLLQEAATRVAMPLSSNVPVAPSRPEKIEPELSEAIPEPEPAAIESAPKSVASPAAADAGPKVPDATARPESSEKIEEGVPKVGAETARITAAHNIVAAPLAAEAMCRVAATGEAANKHKTAREPSPRHSLGPVVLRRDELDAQEPSPSQERTIVFNKLLNRGSERQQQNANDGPSGNGKVQVNGTDAKPMRESHAVTNARGMGVPPNQGSLISLQDIYLAVGILSSRLGYNIDTVSTMLESNHMRGMTPEVKRASVLMALEAAGTPLDDLMRDGAKRLDALNAYETGERKRFDEYEARKTQENVQIQLEMERMTAHCMDRVQHNLSEVTLAKDAFLNWQTTKQSESLRISNAVALFSKPVAVEQASDPKPELQTVGADSRA